MTTLWDTTGSAVVKALSAERRQAGAVASGLALTLVVVARENGIAEAEAAAVQASATHPCRLLVVVRRQLDAPAPRLDAEVTIGGRLGPGEAVVLRMYGRLGAHAESVVLPLLAPDTPVITWWHGDPPQKIAYDPLGVLADRRITDCDVTDDPLDALTTRAQDFAPGDTDLAWTRTTYWRSILASAFDTPPGRPVAGRVTAQPRTATAALLAGWLGSRLSVDVALLEARGRGVASVEIDVEQPDGQTGTVQLVRERGGTAVLRRPGTTDRELPLADRDVGDLLAEEMRRLDADQVYADALSAATGVPGLAERPPYRSHIWHDPTQAAS
ncbi:MAG: glucose-6-phosphate dehydrogenase assembly protein OpcA [Actinomycetota bacterium]|nr:glucose-6-phosphate dehydrogenase assembly protein OpcA [Actinomycetota bacterium]